MPELPEVETVKRGLAPHLEGVTIDNVHLNRADLRLPFPLQFAERLQGQTIGTLARRAKYLLAPLSSHETLVIHLGMSGRLLIEEKEAEAAPRNAPERFHHTTTRLMQHDHAVFHLSSGAALIYNDTRRFGFMLLEPDAALFAHPSLAGLGVEPLGNDFHAEALLTGFSGRKSPLKTTLLDQSIIAGLGNIYVCEALHRAGLSPDRPAGSLNRQEAQALTRMIRDVLGEAVDAGGSSLRDYVQQDGSLGYFQHRFRVYDREGAPCPTPGCGGIVMRKTQAGRSTFYCTQCQN